MILYIKNMVCNRCIMAVNQILERMELPVSRIGLGEVELISQPPAKQLAQLNIMLQELGFELLDDQRQQQIERIKNLLIKKIQSGNVEEHLSISDYLAKALHKDYSYLSRLFSQVEAITIEQYFILQKIEKVKELIVYGEMNLSEISYKLGYSSAAHLSSQFKKVTGFTPSHFKKSGSANRHPLDNVKNKYV
ncbi:MAG: helix-turn-helix transcriptional regulator [Chitinophagaceae bacterium]|nr:helix-turn-helix transcriptional regulator [Chitinophagaceae bacterium]MCA6441425.1 helix-turn-helix transcriptional regulator [Chitinophagaceae bacterium]